MKKPEKSLAGIIKIALLIPAVLITMGLTTGMTPHEKTIKGQVVIGETGEPAPGASIIIRGTTTGTVSDLNGEFTLYVEGDPEIVVSFVGFANIQMKASEVGKKPLELKPETYTMDLESVPLKVIQEDGDGITIRAINDGEDKQPVFVLDGKVVQGIDHYDSDQIERIEVFKDPNSKMVKKYNAPNGVILITSKDAAITSSKKESSAFEKDNEIFYIVEDMPMFPGGRAALKTYIYSNLRYPESAKKKGINGEVAVQFNVTAKGKLQDIGIARSTDKEFEQSAMEIFKDMPDWNPGKQRGKPVKVKVIVPVVFSADKK